MAGNIKGITIEIGGNTQKLDQALKSVNQTAKSLEKELKAVDKALKLDPKNVELVAKKQELLQKSVENTKQKLETLKTAQEQAREAFERGEMGEDKYRALETEIIETESKLKGLESELKETSQAAGGLGTAMQDAGSKISAAGDKMQAAGKALMPLSAAAAAVGAAAVKSAMDIDEGYDIIIQKTGATGDRFEKLKESFDKTFGDMPVTAEQAGTAIGEVSTRFELTGDQLEYVSQQFLKYAEINKTDVASSVGAVDKIMEKFGMDSADTEKVLSLFTHAAQTSGVSVNTLEQALQQNGATFKEMGLDVQESVTLLAEFERTGIDTSTALAGLKKAQQNAAKEGKNLKDALTETITKIENAKDSTEASQIAMELFGKKGAAEMAQAIREGRLDIEDLCVELDFYSGKVEETFEATQDPWDKAKVALNNLKLAGSDLAGVAMESLAPVIQNITEKIKEFTQWFKNLNPEVKMAITKAIAFTAALAPTLTIVGKITSGIGGLVTKIGTFISSMGGASGVLAAITSPAGIAVGALAGVTAGFVHLYNTSDSFREKMNGVLAKVQDAFSRMIEKVKPLLDKLAQAFQQLMQALEPVFTWLAESIAGVLSAVMETIPPIIDTITSAVEVITNIISAFTALLSGDIDGFFEHITSALQGVLDFIVNLLTSVATLIVNLFSALWEAIKNVFSGVVQFFGDLFRNAYNAICTAFQAIGQWFSDRWTDIQRAFSNVISWFSDIFRRALAAIQQVFSSIGQWFAARWQDIQNVFSNVASFFTSVFQAAYQGIVNAFSGIVSFFQNMWNSIVGLFQGAGEAIAGAVSSVFRTALNGVFATVENIVNFFVDAVNGIIGILNNIPGVSISGPSRLSLPRLAKGGTVLRGQAIVGEAGAELLTVANGRATVTPLTDSQKQSTLTAAGRGGNFIQNVNITAPTPLTPYEVARQTRNQTRNMVMQLQGS